MNNVLLQPLMIVMLYVLLRAGDIAIGAITAHAVVRAALYGLVALLALVVLVIALLAHS